MDIEVIEKVDFVCSVKNRMADEVRTQGKKTSSLMEKARMAGYETHYKDYTTFLDPESSIGKVEPGIYKFAGMCYALGVSADQMLFGKESEEDLSRLLDIAKDFQQLFEKLGLVDNNKELELLRTIRKLPIKEQESLLNMIYALVEAKLKELS